MLNNMRVNNRFQATLGLNLYTEDQLEEIHLATLDILERVGVKVFEEESLQLLRDGGARIDGNLVKLPAWMVQEALVTAPRKVNVADREGKRAMALEKRNIYYGTGSDTPYTIDIESGLRRQSLKQDVVNAARISDAMENVDFVMSLGLASDVPVETADVHQFEAMVLNTTKPILYTAHDRQGLKDIIEIAQIAAGGADALIERPFFVLYAEPTSPLVHTKEALEKLLTCAENRAPVIYAPATMLGATGPVTIAGALVVANTEILSGLVIHQLKAKGAPFIYGGGIPPMDMQTSICSYGGPERDLGCISLVRMAQYYNLPVFTTAGCSDAQSFDQQAGMEAGFNILISGLAGGNLIHDLGYIGVGLTSSMEHLLLCNEAAGAVKYLLRGVEVSPATLALELIEKVGPGGNFITERHTLENFRGQMFMTKLLNRNNYDNWKAEGSKTFAQRANEKVKQILSTREVSAIAPEKEAMIKEITARSDRSRHV
jgi:trimethylamine--corrinoid protein Co-methyltransferase